jgi:AAA+ superfamily predicted ATPase
VRQGKSRLSYSSISTIPPSHSSYQTQLAKAIAGEAQAAFLSVGPSDVLSKFVGESEAAVRSFFDKGMSPGSCTREELP